MKLLYLPTANARRDVEDGDGLGANLSSFFGTLDAAIDDLKPDSILLTEVGRMDRASYTTLVAHITNLGFATMLSYRKSQPLSEQTNDFADDYAFDFATVFFTKLTQFKLQRIELSVEEKSPGSKTFFRNGAIVLRDRKTNEAAYAFAHLTLARTPGAQMETVRHEIATLKALGANVRVAGDLNMLSETIDALGHDTVGWLLGNEGQPDFICSARDWIPKKFISADSPRKLVIEEKVPPETHEPMVRIVSTLSVCSANWPHARFFVPDQAQFAAGTAEVTGCSYAKCAARMPVPPAPFDHYVCLLTDDTV